MRTTNDLNWYKKRLYVVLYHHMIFIIQICGWLTDNDRIDRIQVDGDT